MFFDKNKQLQELTEHNHVLEDELVMLQKDNRNYKQTISAFVGVKAGYENEVAKLTQKFTQQIDSLKKSLELEKKSVNKKVNKALADIGVVAFAPEDISGNQPDTSTQSIYSKFVSMPESNEKNEYWQKNQKALSNFAALR